LHLPEIEDIFSQATNASLNSGTSHIVFFDIDQQNWAIIDSSQSLLKMIPEGTSFNKLQENLKITSITVGGYRFESGIPGIMFFPDGTEEYAEIYIEDTQTGDKWTIILNPYTPSLEITKSSQ